MDEIFLKKYKINNSHCDNKNTCLVYITAFDKNYLNSTLTDKHKFLFFFLSLLILYAVQKETNRLCYFSKSFSKLFVSKNERANYK